MSLRRSAHPAVPVAISGLVLAAAHLHGQLEVLLPVVPLLLLLLSLLCGIYPGSETISRIIERCAPRPRLSAAASRPQPTPPSLHAPSGGLLLAFRLAQRPPPFAS